MDLKNIFSAHNILGLTQLLKKKYPPLSVKKFHQEATLNLAQLELKQRVFQLAQVLDQHLPQDFQQATGILLECLASPESTLETTEEIPHSAFLQGLRGFFVWPLTTYIEQRGLQNLPRSLFCLGEMTKRFTAEFAIRPFLIHQQEITLKTIALWAQDPNEHLRRLASEGIRPRLPWGQRLQAFIKNPKAVLIILEILKYDSSLYVRKSVANNLNDISKDHPQQVISLLKKWNQEKVASSEKAKILWITRHALRTLLKKGDPDALTLIGYHPPASGHIELQGLKLASKTIAFGGQLQFSFSLKNTHKQKTQQLMIDYVLHHRRKTGQLHPKTFKLTTKNLAPAEKILIQKSHSFKNVTVRSYYPGQHALEIMVNGKIYSKIIFQLLPE